MNGELEAEVFHDMEECKVGEATTSRYEDITNTLDQVELKTMVHIAFRIEESTKKIFPAIVLLNGNRHRSRAAFVIYEIIYDG
ncbi:uncharacterized protein LOC112004418 isoform X5 [Quercus suber]|uniref:uncharacterized protein LOC112004418 isoform X5 n=1 Tax=Quercus suber TaxID=58331 RepID=UPI0032DF5230